MPYNINITLYDNPVEAPDFQGCDFVDVIKDFPLLDKQYPKERGYTISVGREGSTHPVLSRQAFLDILSKMDDHHTVSAFYHQDEYTQFTRHLQKVTFTKELAGFRPVPESDFALHYPDDLHILHIPKAEQGMDTPYLQWFLPWYPHGFTSDSLSELEAILYEIYLSDLFFARTAGKNQSAKQIPANYFTQKQ